MKGRVLIIDDASGRADEQAHQETDGALRPPSRTSSRSQFSDSWPDLREVPGELDTPPAVRVHPSNPYHPQNVKNVVRAPEQHYRVVPRSREIPVPTAVNACADIAASRSRSTERRMDPLRNGILLRVPQTYSR